MQPQPLAPASTCVIAPEPQNWSSVPPEDHDRLNAVFEHWHNRWGGIHEVSIAIEPTQYALVIHVTQGHVVSSTQLAAINAMPHVLSAECDMRARGTRTVGGVCIYVQAASSASPALRGEAPAPIGGRSYTAALREASRAQAAELTRAARAAAGVD